MKELSELDFPMGIAENIISSLSISDENIQELKELIYFINDLTPSETSDLIYEIFKQVEIQ